jgi:hypothetical protein
MPELLHDKELDRLKRFKKDLDWFQNNYNDLKNDYKNEYVAIKDENLIDHDVNLNHLLNRLKTKYDDMNSIVVEFINENKEIYIL